MVMKQFPAPTDAAREPQYIVKLTPLPCSIF